MRLFIEFPMNVIISYNGPGNLDETLDENISFLIGKHFYENEIDFKILNLEFVNPKPNANDELIQYEIEITINEIEFNYKWILNELKEKGYDKGLTIKSFENEIIYADQFTADIKHRRKLKSRQ